MAERRRAPRADTRLPIRIFQTSADGELEAHTRDLSASGVCCEVHQLLPLMSKVQLTLQLPAGDAAHPEQPIVCAGAVVRVDPIHTLGEGDATFRVAIFFTDVKEADRERIVRYVERQLPTDPSSQSGSSNAPRHP